MRKKMLFLLSFSITVSIITGCADKTNYSLEPMMNMNWFMEYEEVKEILSDYTLIDEREKNEENITQRMQDYADVSLYDVECDLTLCFTDNGLIGFNYHDIDKNNKYNDWFSLLEKNYGYPTEEGSGMASWYDNPLGKNTAVYLFNLQEGVQISFYASSNTPDKSYEKQEELYIPTPEIRTPIIPVVENMTSESDDNEEITIETTSQSQKGEYYTQPVIFEETTVQSEEPQTENIVAGTETQMQTTTVKSKQTTTTTVTSDRIKTTTTTTTTTAVVTTGTVNLKDAYKLNDLNFYGNPSSEFQKMTNYIKVNEYEINEPGNVWELVAEYTDVKYFGKSCDAILCFTSLGLVGINYFDDNNSNYSFWVNQMNEVYGEPHDTQYDYTAWYIDSAEAEVMIYIFALEDGVQISFYVDDTGSKVS